MKKVILFLSISCFMMLPLHGMKALVMASPKAVRAASLASPGRTLESISIPYQQRRAEICMVLFKSLLDSIEKHDVNAVKKQLSQNKGIIFLTDGSGNSIIHRAVASGNSDLIEYFVELGLWVDRPNNDGWTPLHLAAWNGQETIARTLLTKGARANLAVDGGEYDGWTPLHLAAWRGKITLCELLMRHNAHAQFRNANFQTPSELASRIAHAEDEVEKNSKNRRGT